MSIVELDPARMNLKEPITYEILIWHPRTVLDRDVRNRNTIMSMTCVQIMVGSCSLFTLNSNTVKVVDLILPLFLSIKAEFVHVTVGS